MLFCCKSCGVIFQHPLPTNDATAGFYPREYWWSENAAQSGRCARRFRKLEKAYREFVVSDHVRFLAGCAQDNPGGGRLLLDIGCGNGTFLHAAQSRGFRPHGMDASARAVEIAETQYGIPVRQGEIGGKAWDGSRFDFVTMFHVLEHLPDSRLALRYARELLRPGGTLIIQIPNIASAQARLFGRYWYGLDVPRHVINFTPKALSLLLEEMGFEFQIVSRFSLRDNPASIASSMVPWLDPVRRKGRCADSNPMASGLLEIVYLGFFLLALPAAYIESTLGFGATIWAWARPKQSSVLSHQPPAGQKTAFADD
jgi:2-polyprenyl-3-methyl-5-hydroxy-6-metoxy-1,4-benzoquinol methylase